MTNVKIHEWFSPTSVFDDSYSHNVLNVAKKRGNICKQTILREKNTLSIFSLLSYLGTIPILRKHIFAF